MDNGTFVDNLLSEIQRKYLDNETNIQLLLDSVRDHYTHHISLVDRYAKRVIKNIDLRVKDMLDVIDPMWYVVALYHRNKGGLWRDMHKYGVKSSNARSYKTASVSST